MKIAVRRNEKGRGLYALSSFRKGEVITKDPVLVFPDEEAHAKGILHRYTFDWGLGRSALALGPGSIMNHSLEPNVVYMFDRRARAICFVALRSIAAREELLINYNGDPADTTPITFR